MYLDSPLIFMVLQRWPNLRRPSCAAGLVLMTISLLASSFSQSVWHLVLTQGVLYAIGGSLLYNPVLLLLDEWFVRRKGMAFGIMWVSSHDILKANCSRDPSGLHTIYTGRNRSIWRCNPIPNVLGPCPFLFPKHSSHLGSQSFDLHRAYAVLHQASASRYHVERGTATPVRL